MTAVANTLQTCAESDSPWDSIIKDIEGVEIFAPEVVSATEILVNGVNIYYDFEDDDAH